MAPYEEGVNDVYRTSHAQSMQKSASKAAPSARNTAAIASMTQQEKVSYAMPKPKVSLMNNRNKQDHIR